MDGTILILDYSEIEREKVKHILGYIGDFKIIEFTSINDYESNVDGLEGLTLVIMDIAFPYEEAGLRILGELRKQFTKNLPIIVLTRSKKQEHMDAALTHIIYDYMIKPYNISRLESSLKSIIKVEKKFEYDTGSIDSLVISFDKYLTDEMKLADRLKKHLSLILITPNNNQNNRKLTVAVRDQDMASMIMEKARLALRSTDKIFRNTNMDLIAVLPFTDPQGAKSANLKIEHSISAEFVKMNLKMSDFFYITYVTYPEEGKSINTLIGNAYKKVSNKEFLDKITSIADDTRKYASKSYNQFKKWY